MKNSNKLNPVKRDASYYKHQAIHSEDSYQLKFLREHEEELVSNILSEMSDPVWIMITSSLPIESNKHPPMFSIHYSESFPLINYDTIYHNWKDIESEMKARKIIYRGEIIRVFPHEYSIMTNESIAEYVKEGYYLEESTNSWESQTLDTKEERNIYNQALIDGCDCYQAIRVSKGASFEEIESVMSPIGFFRAPKEIEEYMANLEKKINPSLKI